MTLDKNKLRELCEKATPGPWEILVLNERSNVQNAIQTTWTHPQIHGKAPVVSHCVSIEEPKHSVWLDRPDAEFIAESRTALPALLAELEAAEQARDAALRIATNIPSDILEKMLKPPVCGESKTSLSLGLSAKRTGGCGQTMKYPEDWYRCVDCGIWYHKQCLSAHCASEKDALEERVRELTKEVSVMETALREIATTGHCGCMSSTDDEWHTEKCWKLTAKKALSDQGGNNGCTDGA